jgi:predicted MPP superfamily phosphohydrolase
MDRVNDMLPDFVVITGDLITVGLRSAARTAGEVAARLRPTVATLAVLGNHDYGLWHPNGFGGVRGLAEYVTGQFERAGCIVLGNESRDFIRRGSALQFVGTEDLWAPGYNPDRAFRHARLKMATIGLTHNPDGARSLARRGAEWVLAGHTHGKRVPLSGVRSRLFPTQRNDFVAGRYDLPGGRGLYVNRGLGRPRRDDADRRPEIAVMRLIDTDLACPSGRSSHRPVGAGA